jgi:NAD(P)-dependent dehydrogenase (short-subunit alcohol dehydrogenase family)
MNNRKWTTDQIPDLTGKVIIVTGGNSGLGYESVKAFAEKGATVIMASRSLDKAEAAKKEILGHAPKGKIIVMQLDLMDLKSIKTFAQEFKTKYNRVDVLLNNAGIMMTPYSLTENGFESQFGTNHLSHFALTGLLYDLIENTPDSRIVNVSSLAHKQGKIDFNNLLDDQGKTYDPIKSYRRSKLANLLFTYELQRRLSEKNKDTLALAAHPGISPTNLANHLKDSFLFKVFELFAGFISHSVEKGALPQIRASVDPDAKGGEYYGPDGWKEMKGDPVIVQSNKNAHNQESARKLWEVSEELTGVKFKI